MTREQAMAALPALHRELLELVASGVGHDVIADRLGLEPATVPSLIVVAHQKFDRVLATSTEGTSHASID